MASRIDWYLVELERMLKGRISLEALNDLQIETRAHIESARDALIAKGCEPNNSEVEAIKTFGSPRDLALGALGESANRPGLWSVWLAAGLAFLALWNQVIWLLWAPRSYNAWYMAMAAVGLAIAVGLWSRRRVLLPLAGALTIGALIATFTISRQVLDFGSVGGSGMVMRRDVPRILNQVSAERGLRNSLITELKKDAKSAFRNEVMLNAAWEQFRYPRYPYRSGLPDERGWVYGRPETFRDVMRDDASVANYRHDLIVNAKRYIERVEQEQHARDEYFGWVRAAEQLPATAFLSMSAGFAFGMAAMVAVPVFLAIYAIRAVLHFVNLSRLARRAIA